MKQSSNGDQAQSASPSKYRKLNGYTIQSSSTSRTRTRLLYAILFVIIWIGGTRSGRKSQQQTKTLSNDSRENSDNIAMDALNLLIEQGRLTKDDVSSAIQEAHSTRNKPVNHDICTNKCLWRMGTNGTWIQDWEYARAHGQYLNAHFPNGKVLDERDWRFKPTKESPFQWRTSFRWQDFEPGCNIDIMTKDKLCSVLIGLDVHRIFMHGDSLTRNMYFSLMNMLGKGVITFDERDTKLYTSSMNCNMNHTIKFKYEQDQGGYQRGKRGIWEISLKGQEFLASTSERTIGIFNIGAHYHNFSHLKEDVDDMMKTISYINRHQDIYFFRTTSPGHDECPPHDPKGFNWEVGPKIEPLKSYRAYEERCKSIISCTYRPHRFAWDMFETYNAYIKNVNTNITMIERDHPFII